MLLIPGVDEGYFCNIRDRPDVVSCCQILRAENSRHSHFQELTGLPLSLEAKITGLSEVITSLLIRDCLHSTQCIKFKSTYLGW